MSQSTRCAGQPTKRPRLVNHTATSLLDALDQVHHDRHCIFSLQPSGKITLQTLYIPPNLTLDDPGESTLFDTQPEPGDMDPWNEVEHFTPVICEDANLGSELLKVRHRKTTQDHPILLWLPEWQTFVEEFIRLEGRGKHANNACQCGAKDAVFRCQDCFSVQLTCCLCTIQSHVNVLLHRIKKDGFFHPVSLKSMGLHVQLSHYPGTTCRRPKPAYGNDFVVINVHGIHEIALDFCGCKHKVSHFKQLLCARWFPSMVTDPRTAATFAVLEFFHILSFKSKDCYSRFLRMVIEWRNCKALKCSGHGHNPNGVHSMNDGDLAVLCPACPHPGKNLPDGWETASNQWKYGLFLAVDANFHLKCRMVSSDEKDPGLSRGWGYFVDETDYKHHLNSLTGIAQEKSTCVSHNAMNMADTKSWKALSNFSALQRINISYDVACQWHKKLWPHMSMLPSRLHFNQDGKVIKFFVPKFHLAAHIEVCQTEFSFNWTPGVGRTDGEAPERGWANMNRVASSTKEMGPGSQRDTLNDHFSDSNWKKVTALGRALLRKISDAVVSEKEHRHALHNFQSSITESEVGAASLSVWRAEIEAWEIDHSQPNPFQSRVANAKELEDGSVIPLHTEVTCSVFLSTGIDLEHTQHRLRADVCALGQHSTNIQRTKILTQRTVLQHHIDTWTNIQILYMPMVPNLRASVSLLPPNDNDNDDSGCPTLNPNSGNAEDFQLLLPSELCNILYQYKTQHVHGQGASTCARKMLDAIEEHLMLSHTKYASAHKALVSLSHHTHYTGWEQKLPPLKKAHLRPMGDFGGQTQGTAIMSWIWLTHSISTNDNEGLQDCSLRIALHMEWCKARARHNRWVEEIQLLLEEMQCLRQWDSQASRSSSKQPKEEEEEGFVAYARRQAHTHRRLAAVFKESWRKVPDLIATGLDEDLLVEEDDGPSLDEPPCEDIKDA
ncbi:hypothetical protein DFH29DRAFT_985953 [Suillus ampliporus]|nr:hypothetical protein DFH29DRAFT_985953 [Suillus ampliporus]